MCAATELRTNWLSDKSHPFIYLHSYKGCAVLFSNRYETCRRVAKQIRDQGDAPITTQMRYIYLICPKASRCLLFPPKGWLCQRVVSATWSMFPSCSSRTSLLQSAKVGTLLLLPLLLLLLPPPLLLLLLLTVAPDLLLPALPALHTVAHTALDTQSARLRQGISRCVPPLTLHT
jgi:hypothetical protein